MVVAKPLGSETGASRSGHRMIFSIRIWRQKRVWWLIRCFAKRQPRGTGSPQRCQRTTLLGRGFFFWLDDREDNVGDLRPADGRRAHRRLRRVVAVAAAPVVVHAPTRTLDAAARRDHDRVSPV